MSLLAFKKRHVLQTKVITTKTGLKKYCNNVALSLLKIASSQFLTGTEIKEYSIDKMGSPILMRKVSSNSLGLHSLLAIKLYVKLCWKKENEY